MTGLGQTIVRFKTNRESAIEKWNIEIGFSKELMLENIYGGWLSGWNYRRPITISNTGSSAKTSDFLMQGC